MTLNPVKLTINIIHSRMKLFKNKQQQKKMSNTKMQIVAVWGVAVWGSGQRVELFTKITSWEINSWVRWQIYGYLLHFPVNE